MTTKTRKRAAATANADWVGKTAQQKAAATRAANHEREVALGKERAAGLRLVALDSIADQLDEVDPLVRGAIHTAPRPRATPEVYSAPYDFSPHTAPRRFQTIVVPSTIDEVGRKEMQEFVSAERVTFKRTGAPGGGHGIRVKLPQDIVRRIGDRLEGVAFDVELNDDGILFRPATATSGRPVALPAWVPVKTK